MKRSACNRCSPLVLVLTLAACVSQPGQQAGGAAPDQPPRLLQAGETLDEVTEGARLVISYAEASGTFNARVENTTARPLCQVTVKIHLEDGTLLGPTAPLVLEAGQSARAAVFARKKPVTAWRASLSTSPCREPSDPAEGQP